MSRRPRTVIGGGGGAGRTTAFRLLEAKPDADVVVLEAEASPGGNVKTLRRDGCVVDMGPDAVLTQPDAAIALFRSLGLGDRLTAPGEGAGRILVAHRGALVPMPDGMAFGVPRSLGQLATTRLLSLGGKLRAAADLLLPRRPPGEISVGALVERRLGREVKDHLVEPIVGAIYAGDVDRLDAATVMPAFAAARRSLIGALAGAPRGKGSPFRAPNEGMSALVDALVRAVGEQRIRTGSRITALERDGDRFRVRLEGAEPIEADRVVLAVPPHAAASLVRAALPDLARELDRFIAHSTATVVVAYERSEAPLPEAGGMLTPRKDGSVVTAAPFVAPKWPGRVREGLAGGRAAIGGARSAELCEQGDDAIAEAVAAELGRHLGTRKPAWSVVQRFPRATPQPVVGHARVVADARARAAEARGLYLAGAAYDGPGIAGCARGAAALAAALAAD